MGAWLAAAGSDVMWLKTGTSSTALRVQRAVSDAAIAVRAARVRGVLAAGAGLTVTLRRFPSVSSKASDRASGSAVEAFGGVFYFSSCMFIFTVVVNQVVGEKEAAFLAAMRSAGLFESVYWLSWMLHYGIIMLASTLLLYAGGMAADLRFFTNTAPGPLLLGFYAYAMAMVGFACALAAVVPRVRTANIVSFLLFAFGLILQVVLSLGGSYLSYIFYDPFSFSSAGRNAILLYPPLRFAKLVADVTTNTAGVSVVAGNTSNVIYGSFTWADYVNGNSNYTWANQSSASCPDDLSDVSQSPCSSAEAAARFALPLRHVPLANPLLPRPLSARRRTAFFTYRQHQSASAGWGGPS